MTKPLTDALHEPSCHPQVGLPAPDRHTSPIVDADQSIADLLSNTPLHGCLFNDVPHAVGEVVQSGPQLLRCAAPGVWVRETAMPAAAVPPGAG
jgi:hypothetical protein